MTLIEKQLFRRNLLVFVLVASFLVIILTISAYILATHRNIHTAGVKGDRLNILLIIVDDLRPALGCYGDTKAITPNIDQLAAKSLLFNNAYAQLALSGPSRTSFLTGQRPDSLCLYDNDGEYWRDKSNVCNHTRNFITLPQHFKHHGYDTVSIGKVFHHGTTSNFTGDYPYSWSSMPYQPPGLKDAEVCSTADGDRMNLLCPVSSAEYNLPDVQVADWAVDYLHNRSSMNPNDPFFLAVGFYKPHIPFKVPSKYLDLYPLEDMDLARDNTWPQGMPDVAWNPWTDLHSKDDVKALNIESPFGYIPRDFQKRIRQSYYASVSYIDDQVGKILEALELSGYASNTAIFFLSDHGWSLGEHGEWSKYSNFDVSLRIPLLTYVPDLTELVKEHKGFQHISVAEINPKEHILTSTKFVADEFVELVDLFPTLAEIANIAVPPICPLAPGHSSLCSEGASFLPVLWDHASPSVDFTWKLSVFSQYPRPSATPKNNSDQPKLKNIKIMGYTIREKFFRYTRWVWFNNWNLKPHWGTFEGHELYDESRDPSESQNLVDEPNYSSSVISLFKKLRKGWRYSLPYGVVRNSLQKM